MISIGNSLASVNVLNNAVADLVPSLLDLRDPISIATADPFTVLSSTNISALLQFGGGASSRGGWSFASGSGNSYELEYSVSYSGTRPTGSLVRVVPDDQFGGNSIANSGNAPDSGTLAFTGTGGSLWIGPALLPNGNTQIYLSTYILREV